MFLLILYIFDFREILKINIEILAHVYTETVSVSEVCLQRNLDSIRYLLEAKHTILGHSHVW